MLVLLTVAVDFGAQLSGQPLPGVYPNLAVVRLQILVVSDVGNVVGIAVGLGLACAGVLVREVFDGAQPFEDRRLGRHASVFADRPKRPAVCNVLTDVVGNDLIEL